MLNGKKIIGICLTRINDNIHAEYVAKIQKAAEALDYRVVLMNSLVDFFFDDTYDELSPERNSSDLPAGGLLLRRHL